MSGLFVVFKRTSRERQVLDFISRVFIYEAIWESLGEPVVPKSNVLAVGASSVGLSEWKRLGSFA